MTAAIVLTGLSGAGKTSVGMALAKRLGWTFVDMDTAIEETYGSPIAEIFTSQGEAFFRELETTILQKLTTELTNSPQNHVISTGGGVVISEQNRKLLKSLGKVVFLTAPVKVLAARLSGDMTRPLLNTNDNQLNNYPQSGEGDRLILKLENLLQRRKQAYMEADLVVDTSHAEAPDIACKIQALLQLEANRL